VTWAVFVILMSILAIGIWMVSRTYVRTGYHGEVIVRCRDGHVFTTIWIPGMSLKAIRLGRIRWQRCPVGDHLTFVTPVDYADLTERERRMARQFHDGRIA
jgi:hypothetical protein